MGAQAGVGVAAGRMAVGGCAGWSGRRSEQPQAGWLWVGAQAGAECRRPDGCWWVRRLGWTQVGAAAGRMAVGGCWWVRRSEQPQAGWLLVGTQAGVAAGRSGRRPDGCGWVRRWVGAAAGRMAVGGCAGWSGRRSEQPQA